ncbi:hypothetical protein ABPG74_021295 [Tetrahymena malaccensis]
MRKLHLNNQKQQTKQEITSQIKQIKISWIIEPTQSTQQNDVKKLESEVKEISQDDASQYVSKFGLSHCPGKKLAKGRDGKVHDRDLKVDIEQFSSQDSVKTIICLLNDYELRSIGVDVKQYQKICQEKGITFVQYPIIEMSVPECKNMDQFDQEVIQFIINEMKQNRNVLCHCRGGIGRAGLIASCLLLRFKIKNKWSDAIQLVRSIRDQRCVESKKQETFVQQYQNYLQQKQL